MPVLEEPVHPSFDQDCFVSRAKLARDAGSNSLPGEPGTAIVSIKPMESGFTWGMSVREAHMRPPFAPVGALLLLVAIFHNAAAQSPQFVPAYPLYCAGPLATGAPSGGETTTPFQWASVGAGTANPAPGQCVWADRAPRGSEILPGGGNVICDFSSAM